MKRLLLCLLLVCCLTGPIAHAEVRTAIDREFFLSSDVWSEENQLNPQTFRAATSSKSVWAVLYNDGSIWRWASDTGDYQYVTRVSITEMTEKSFSRLSTAERESLMTSATDRITADGRAVRLQRPQRPLRSHRRTKRTLERDLA